MNAQVQVPPRLDAMLDAIGDRTRRAILLRLQAGPQPVVEIARALPVGRPAVSQHLKVLKTVGLVTVHQKGTRRHYGLDPNGFATLRGWLDGLWDTALDAYKTATEFPGRLP